jgi:hypothetical protein
MGMWNRLEIHVSINVLTIIYLISNDGNVDMVFFRINC